MPKMSFTCDVKIIKAAADVNPEDTGPEMKSIIKPGILNRIWFSERSVLDSGKEFT